MGGPLSMGTRARMDALDGGGDSARVSPLQQAPGNGGRIRLSRRFLVGHGPLAGYMTGDNQVRAAGMQQECPPSWEFFPPAS